jgi:hypothetical protein
MGKNFPAFFFLDGTAVCCHASAIVSRVTR